MKKKLVTTLLSVLGVVVLIAASAAADAVSYHFEGNGTKAEPYLIGSADDLLAFATAVNAGNSYDGMYFRQTQDINLADIDWPGIGVYETDACFMGTYNGDGHCVTNLNVAVGGNNAFFGKLGGTLMNFGIESGSISGSCVGGISSHSGKADALIINCYNKATVTGARAGGIADNFNGMLANCFSDCELIAASTEYVGGIVSYGAASIVSCISIEPRGRSGVMPTGSRYIDSMHPDYTVVAETLNRTAYEAAVAAGIDVGELNRWQVNKAGDGLVFSNEKSGFSMRYLGPWLLMNGRRLLPYALIFVSLLAILLLLLKSPLKKEDING